MTSFDGKTLTVFTDKRSIAPMARPKPCDEIHSPTPLAQDLPQEQTNHEPPPHAPGLPSSRSPSRRCCSLPRLRALRRSATAAASSATQSKLQATAASEAIAAELRDRAMRGESVAWDIVSELTTRIGPRPAGSAGRTCSGRVVRAETQGARLRERPHRDLSADGMGTRHGARRDHGALAPTDRRHRAGRLAANASRRHRGRARALPDIR